MIRKLESRLFWLVLFVLSIGVVISIYLVLQFTTIEQVEKNTARIKTNTKLINDTAIREQQIKTVTDRQTFIMDSIINHSGVLEHRQDNIMKIVNADVIQLNKKLDSLNEKLNILLNKT